MSENDRLQTIPSARSHRRTASWSTYLYDLYLYDLEDIEQNHEAYAQQRTAVASKQVTSLARAA
jgi:hypothetical protein